MTFTETWSWTELKDWVTETGVGQVTAGNQEDIRIGYGGKGNTAKYTDTVNNTARSAEVEPPRTWHKVR